MPKRNQNQQFQKKNAPELAYETVYGRPPKNGLRGRAINTVEKRYKDIYIDQHLDEEVFDQLNDIRNVEIRSSCEGHSSDRPAFLIFRVSQNKIKNIDKIVDNLHKQGVQAKYEIGNHGRYRICVATRNWYRENADNREWENWWKNLPHVIENAVNSM